MQFNKNKSSPSILSIVNVVFTRKNQNFWKKASTIFFIKKRSGVRTTYYRLLAGWGEEAAVDCLLMLHCSTAPVCPMSPQPRAHSHHANCLMPQPPPPIGGGNICTGGNQCNILLITRRPGRDGDVISLHFTGQGDVITGWLNKIATLMGSPSAVRARLVTIKKYSSYVGDSLEVSLYFLV